MTKYVLNPPNIIPEKDDLNVLSDGFDFLKKGIYKNCCLTKKKIGSTILFLTSHTTLINVSILNVMFNCILRGINRCEQK